LTRCKGEEILMDPKKLEDLPGDRARENRLALIE